MQGARQLKPREEIPIVLTITYYPRALKARIQVEQPEAATQDYELSAPVVSLIMNLLRRG